MKKNILIALTLLLNQSLFAQLTIAPKIGITNFYQKSHLTGTYSTYSRQTSVGKTSYTFGGSFNYQLGDVFSIRPELLFERVCFTDVQSDLTLAPVFYQEDHVKLNYLTMPINIAFTNRKVIFLSGVRFSYLMGGTVDRRTIASDSTSLQTEKEETIKATGSKSPSLHPTDAYHANPLNVSLSVGGGYKLTDRLQLEFQYIFGLSNTTPHYKDSTLESNRVDFKVKNKGFTISLLYYFGSVN